MIIIVEGIDRVGKTTLCDMLKEKYSLPVFKFQPLYPITSMLRNCEVDNCMLQMLETLEGHGVDIVLDRFTMSELVYGLMDRNYNASAPYKLINERLLKMDCLLIYVEPTDIEESSRQHGENLKFHDVLFNDCYTAWAGDKIKTNYLVLDEAVEIVGKRLEAARNA